MKVYVIVQPLKTGHYDFVDVKATKKEAEELVNELKELNKSVGVPEAQCKIIQKNI